jgi:trimeric autotransporter adhesin
MKTRFVKHICLIAALCIIAINKLMGQSPMQLSYQAIIRDGVGIPITDADKTIKFSILQGSPTGPTVYWEIQAVHTNSYGLVNLKIGSVRAGIETIDWSNGPYYLQVEVDAIFLGTTQIVSVPYALYAAKAGNGFSGVYNDLTGKPDLSVYLQSETDPAFNASVAKTITSTEKSNWNTSYSWGNHSSAGYLTSQVSHADVVVDGDFASNGILKRTSAGVYGIVTDNSSNWNSAYGWGDHSIQGYLKTEVDPIFNASAAKAISSTDINNWNNTRWIRTDDSLYYTKGNVGVGTKDPRSTLTVAGTTPTDSAIFEVKNNNGVTVFAVYNDGVKITLDETTKGTKGGFAIGGLSAVKGVNRDYMKVTGDSIRLYLDNKAPVKGATKGGFAIGGFDVAKATTGRYMNISTDAGTSSGYNTFLGYKAGGAGSGGLYNIAIGRYSGYNLNLATSTLGRNNIFIGDSAGFLNGYGYQNIYIGRYAGAGATTGYHNIYIGYLSGSSGHGQYNTFVGDEAGRYNNNGWSNVFFGNSAGRSVTSGYQNTLLGTQAGWKLGTGYENTFIGNSTGFEAVNTNGNTFIGSGAGNGNISGNNNLFIGKWSGQQATGSNNIFIGANSGSSITSGDNMLIIDNTSSSIYTALIGGDLANDKLIFGADVGVHGSAPAGDAFYVYGKAESTVGWFTISDARKKTNIREITNPLEKVLSLRGVTFDWKDQAAKSTGSQIGFIAQEAMNILPEVVSKSGDYYSIQYAPMTALLVEAIKVLKRENDDLKDRVKEIEELKMQVNALRTLLMPEKQK